MGGRDAQELLGARRVPKLGSHSLIGCWQRNSFEFKFDTISCLGFLLELMIDNPVQEIRLSYVLVADDNDFVKVVETFSGVFESSTGGLVERFVEHARIRSDAEIASRRPFTLIFCAFLAIV